MKIKFSLTLRKFCVTQLTIVTIVIGLGLFASGFVYLTGYDFVLGLIPLLDVGEEESIPTYVAIINLLLASILIFIIYRFERTNNQNGAGYWLFLSILFLYLSIDESSKIHEKFGNIYRYFYGMESSFPVLDVRPWLPFGIFFVSVVFVILLPFIKRLPSDTRRYFLIAGCIFVTGALGFEFLEAWMLETGSDETKQSLAYLFRGLIEDAFEMYGIVIFNYALYREILRRKISVIIGG